MMAYSPLGCNSALYKYMVYNFTYLLRQQVSAKHWYIVITDYKVLLIKEHNQNINHEIWGSHGGEY
jgi:hypothetical protein